MTRPEVPELEELRTALERVDWWGGEWPTTISSVLDAARAVLTTYDTQLAAYDRVMASATDQLIPPRDPRLVMDIDRYRAAVGLPPIGVADGPSKTVRCPRCNDATEVPSQVMTPTCLTCGATWELEQREESGGDRHRGA